MPAAVGLISAGGRMDEGSEVACTLRAPRTSGVVADAWPEGFSVAEQQTDDHQPPRQEIINHLPVVAQADIPDKVVNWFHEVEDEYGEQVQDQIQMFEHSDLEQDAVADELVDLQKQLDDKVQAPVAKQAECYRSAQHASDDIKDNAPPLLVDDATANETVKLKQVITAKKALSKSMQATLGAALQEVKETKKALATTEDKRGMISEQMEWAMMELNATNEALIQVKANSAPVSTFQTNSSNRVFNVKATGLLTHDGTRTLHAVISCLSTMHRSFGPSAQELGLADEYGIPLTNGRATAAMLQFHDKAAVWANHHFPVHASAGVAWEDFSAAVKEAFIRSDSVTRLKWDWESLRI